MIARITVIFGLIVSSVVPFAAQADVLPSTWRFVGSVQDGLGRPLAGAKVVDHYNRTAITNEQGRYVLAMNSTGGRYTLRASRSDTLTATKVVDVDVPYGEVEVDFVPVYRISETVSPYRVTALPATMVLSATTTAPPEGLCVVAKEGQDYHDESGTPISLERDVNDATRWSLTRQLGADYPSGHRWFRFQALDCATGTPLTQSSPLAFWIDTPDITAPVAHVPWSGYLSIASSYYVDTGDGRRRQTGPIMRVAAGATDNIGFSKGVLTVSKDGETIFTCEDPSSYGDLKSEDFSCRDIHVDTYGTYTVSFYAVDSSDNLSNTVTWDFEYGPETAVR